jgi:hypothetical protein
MRKKISVSSDYEGYLVYKAEKRQAATNIDAEEQEAIKRQNVFGLKMISFSLLFMSVLLLLLAFITSKATTLVVVIAITIMLGSIIPWRAAKRKALNG